MGSACFEQKQIEYITGGNVINVNFRDKEGDFKKTIRIHEVNSLRKAIMTYQETINKENLIIKKAIYEPDGTTLSLNTPLNELNINFTNTIIVYFKK